MNPFAIIIKIFVFLQIFLICKVLYTSSDFPTSLEGSLWVQRLLVLSVPLAPRLASVT